MPLSRDALAFLVRTVVIGLAAAFVIGLVWPQAGLQLRERLGLAPAPAGAPSAAGGLQGPFSYADAAAAAAPAVVSIYANRSVIEQPLRLVPDPLLQRFSGIPLGPPRQRREQALGSGVIVSPDGYLLTNHHVIARADDIQVALWDGRVTQAQVIGSDQDTDLAVLKLDGTGLPALDLAQGAPLRVGDVVLAIGNPFGLGNTVTQGIVSGLGRNQLNLSTYEDFIQTDAAINEGNSGGALVNAAGRLIGINTFVIGRNAGAEGIGFAIPVSTARQVLEQIVAFGMVVRGWLGAEYDDAPILPGGLEPGAPRGVALGTVYAGGPADAAGLRAGDVLLKIDGVDIQDQATLRAREAALKPGTRIQLIGLRAGLPFSADVTLIQRPQPRG